MIRVEGLRKTFESKAETVRAVEDVSFEVAPGEIITLLGPSGCGKTTTLRCVAGLERPAAGRVAIGQHTVVDCAAGVFVPPHRRNLGMVFQSYAIWPHMSVFENVAYALEGRRLRKSEVKALTLEALERVKLAHLADRPAPRLSGGQQQRVAIARALVGKPQALLFDEPLSNLDAKLRVEMRGELRRLQKQIGLTSIYVTHDQAEALAISDWIILMRDGRIVETGRPAQIYRYPQHVFTAQFIGNTNLIPGRVASVNGTSGRVVLDTPLGPLVGTDPGKRLAMGAAAQLSVRPEDIIPSHGGSAGHSSVNRIDGAIEFAIFAGTAVEAEVRCGEMKIQCLLGREVDFATGRQISLRFSPEVCVVLPEE
jgi:iron(III) transport system ATP-binding protein